MYKIIFYVPPSHVDIVKEAVFNTGAGKLGNYERCAWQVLGEGQFFPLSQSAPFIGDQGKLEKLEEYRVEVACEEQYLSASLHALRDAHPYEEPAIDVLRLAS